MMKKKIWGILTVTALGVGVTLSAWLITGKTNGVTDAATQRPLADIENATVVYLDDEALAGAAESSTDPSLKSAAIEAYIGINEIRTSNGEEPLTWDSNLESVSDVRAAESSEVFSHTRPDGSPWYTVNSNIQGGENLAWGQTSPAQVVNEWMASPTHADNILYDDFTTCAVSLYQDDSQTNYWALEFGY